MNSITLLCEMTGVFVTSGVIVSTGMRSHWFVTSLVTLIFTISLETSLALHDGIGDGLLSAPTFSVGISVFNFSVFPKCLIGIS